jgi:peptidyl-tRNA hydrolase
VQKYEKLYIITRQDLSPGLQAAQVAHAAFMFGYEHRPLAQAWIQESNFLIILSVKNEQELKALGDEADKQGLPVTWFTEPDIEDELTAIAIAPSPQTVELTCKLPLALSEMVPFTEEYGIISDHVKLNDSGDLVITLESGGN